MSRAVLTSDPPLSLLAWQRLDAVERLLPAGTQRVLEIGAGLGSVGALLARRFDYTGLEPDREAFETATRRIGSAGRVFELAAEDFTDSHAFDLVCAFEVLEHFDDDLRALSSWARFLRPGGYVLLSVPLGSGRYGAWDERAGHFRRYDRADLVDVLERAGLASVETVTYGFPLGSAAEVVRNVVARLEPRRATMDERTTASGRSLQPPEWAAVVTRIVARPFTVIQRPFARTSLGPGIVARARLPEGPG